MKMTKFHIKFECNKEVLADLIAMGLTKDAVVIEMKRAQDVPSKQYSFDELKPKVRETQSISAMPVVKRKVARYTQQTTCWEVYKLIEEHFNPQKSFLAKDVLLVCRWHNPAITKGSVSSHLTKMRSIGVIKSVTLEDENANRYVLAKLVSKQDFTKLVRENPARKVNMLPN